MKHLVGRKFGRRTDQRVALFRHLVIALVENEIIRTTLPKAKDLRRVAERLITLSKEDTVAHRRLAFDRIRNAAAVKKLFDVIGPRSVDRPGGYLRILKCGNRQNDCAPMAIVEWVDREGKPGAD